MNDHNFTTILNEITFLFYVLKYHAVHNIGNQKTIIKQINPVRNC